MSCLCDNFSAALAMNLPNLSKESSTVIYGSANQIVALTGSVEQCQCRQSKLAQIVLAGDSRFTEISLCFRL